MVFKIKYKKKMKEFNLAKNLGILALTLVMIFGIISVGDNKITGKAIVDVTGRAAGTIDWGVGEGEKTTADMGTLLKPIDLGNIRHSTIDYRVANIAGERVLIWEDSGKAMVAPIDDPDYHAWTTDPSTGGPTLITNSISDATHLTVDRPAVSSTGLRVTVGDLPITRPTRGKDEQDTDPAGIFNFIANGNNGRISFEIDHDNDAATPSELHVLPQEYVDAVRQEIPYDLELQGIALGLMGVEVGRSYDEFGNTGASRVRLQDGYIALRDIIGSKTTDTISVFLFDDIPDSAGPLEQAADNTAAYVRDKYGRSIGKEEAMRLLEDPTFAIRASVYQLVPIANQYRDLDMRSEDVYYAAGVEWNSGQGTMDVAVTQSLVDRLASDRGVSLANAGTQILEDGEVVKYNFVVDGKKGSAHWESIARVLNEYGITTASGGAISSSLVQGNLPLYEQEIKNLYTDRVGRIPSVIRLTADPTRPDSHDVGFAASRIGRQILPQLEGTTRSRETYLIDVVNTPEGPASDAEGTIILPANNDFQLSPNFRSSEFNDQDSLVEITRWRTDLTREQRAALVNQEVKVNTRLVQSLEDIRARLSARYIRDEPGVTGVEIELNSGYRNEQYNSMLPGASASSKHPDGMAIDMKVIKLYSDGRKEIVPPMDVAGIIDEWHPDKFGLLPHATGDFMHFEVLRSAETKAIRGVELTPLPTETDDEYRARVARYGEEEVWGAGRHHNPYIDSINVRGSINPVIPTPPASTTPPTATATSAFTIWVDDGMGGVKEETLLPEYDTEAKARKYAIDKYGRSPIKIEKSAPAGMEKFYIVVDGVLHPEPIYAATAAEADKAAKAEHGPGASARPTKKPPGGLTERTVKVNGKDQKIVWDELLGVYWDKGKEYSYSTLSSDWSAFVRTKRLSTTVTASEYYEDGVLSHGTIGIMEFDADTYNDILTFAKTKGNDVSIDPNGNSLEITKDGQPILIATGTRSTGETKIEQDFVKNSKGDWKPQDIVHRTYDPAKNVQTERTEQINFDTNNDGKIDENDHEGGKHTKDLEIDFKTNGRGGYNKDSGNWEDDDILTYTDYTFDNEKGEQIKEKITYDSDTLEPTGVEVWEDGVRDSSKDRARITKLKDQNKWRNNLFDLERVTTEFSGLAGYSRLFMDDEDIQDWKLTVDEYFSYNVFGEEFWVSQICEKKIEDIPDNVLVITTPSGLIATGAHIEGERSQPITYPNGTVLYLYKITFVINNPEGGYEDLEANVLLMGQRNINLFEENQKIDEGEVIKKLGEEAIIQYSKFDYKKVCIQFSRNLQSLDGETQDEVCTKIITSDTPASVYTPPPFEELREGETPPGPDDGSELVDF